MISKISSIYKMNANAAAMVYTLGLQVSNSLKNGNGSLTPEDTDALAGTLENYFKVDVNKVADILVTGSEEEKDKLFAEFGENGQSVSRESPSFFTRTDFCRYGDGVAVIVYGGKVTDTEGERYYRGSTENWF